MDKDTSFAPNNEFYTTLFRGYDPRKARWLQRDPIHHPWESAYAAFENNPIMYVDPLGDRGLSTPLAPAPEDDEGGGGSGSGGSITASNLFPNNNFTLDLHGADFSQMPSQNMGSNNYNPAQDAIKDHTFYDKNKLDATINPFSFSDNGTKGRNNKNFEFNIKILDEKLDNKSVAAIALVSGITSGLVADDATVIGAYDDLAIPVIWTLTAGYVVWREFFKKTTYQYKLVAFEDGDYSIFVRGQKDPLDRKVHLKKGDVWKYGITCQYDEKGQQRYSEAELTAWKVKFVVEFEGSRVEALIMEQMKLIHYYNINGELPPGNKIFR